MNFKPLYDRLIIKPNEADQMTAGGLYIPSTAQEKSQLGTDVEAGDGRIENGVRIPLTCSIGDTVLYGKYAGTEIEIEKTTYIIIKESDILAYQK